MSSPVLRLAAWLLAAAVIIAACTPEFDPGPPVEPAPDPSPQATENDDDDPRSGGTLRVGLSADPATLDPRFFVDDEAEVIVDALFDPLVRLDHDHEVVPAAAERYDVNDDATVFTFYLADRVFHDGTPVTADDFARTFQHIADGTREQQSFLDYLLEGVVGLADTQQSGVPLAGVEVEDQQTLQIRLDRPDPAFLSRMTDPALVPLPAQADEDPDAFAAAPVGNGPFLMAGEREPGAFVRVARFEAHPDPPLLDEVLFTIYDDDGARSQQWQDLQDGQLHVGEVPPEHLDTAAELFGRSGDGYSGPGLLQGTTATSYLFGIDNTQPPFDDPRLRRALSLAIDRDALATEVMGGSRVPATAVLPPAVPGARPGGCGDCRHDPEVAASLFNEVVDDLAQQTAEGDVDSEPADSEFEEEADGPDGSDGEADDPDAPVTDDVGDQGATADEPAEEEPSTEAEGDDPEVADLDRLVLTHNQGVTHTAIAEQVASDIEDALDIEVDFQARDLQRLIQDARAGRAPVFRLGWETNQPDPGSFLTPLFHSSQVDADNLMGYASEEVDEFLDQARETLDDAERADLYATAEQQILTDMAVIPVLWYRHSTVVTDEVANLRYSPFGRINFPDVWLDSNTG